MKLDYKQIYKLGFAVDLISDVLDQKQSDPKTLATCLSVAGKYCQEIAKDCYDQGTKEAVRGKQKIA